MAYNESKGRPTFMPMTHAPETGARKLASVSGAGLWSVCLWHLVIHLRHNPTEIAA